ncbi:DNA adenine methylase [Pseudomonas sp. M30-35]|uniref:DNA adenine methylase n=1 Tax=Pseudomonas sp. M30-35 TaxID=1981174 RepID=UPI000B3C5388|nr:DNA adenine methylase [Pseudomonas sp. M30-35]ARU88304.1 restriction endonuclease subunit M [Pseudomonas sp. M30-35]
MSSPIIPWMGGKRRMAKHILPEFPAHECYVEPFCGGAAMFFMKEPSKVEVINDFDGEVVNLYRVVAHHLDELVRQFRWSLVSRTMFEWTNMQVPQTLTDIQRAARFFYLQQTCFGAKPVSRTFGTATTTPPRLNLLRIEEKLSEAHLRLSRTTVEHLDWQACIKRYDREHTLFYLDPPYLETAGYSPGEFGVEQYQVMAALAGSIKGRMVISINDHPLIREVFAGLRLKEVPFRHNVGGKGGKEVTELIYFNW